MSRVNSLVKDLGILKDVLVPRNVEEREEKQRKNELQKIREYIKNGCKGNLNLQYSKLTKLPDDLVKVNGSIYLQGSNINDLNNLKYVKRDIGMNDYITKLPDDLEWNGKLEEWGLSVESKLRKEDWQRSLNNMVANYIKKPTNRYLIIHRTKFELIIPDELIEVKGNITTCSSVKTLNNIRYIGGVLHSTHYPMRGGEECKLEYLPDNLHVMKNVYLGRNNISEIPNGLRIEKSLHIGGNPIAEKYNTKQIRKMIEDKGGYVKGRIYVAGSW
jgi:hypothetical protein